MTMHPYASKLLAAGFELQSEDGEPLSVCEAATWLPGSEGFKLEIDHGEGTGLLIVEKIVPDPVDGMPIMHYEVDNDLHLQIQSDRFKGISPVIEVLEVNDNSNKFTKYRIDGISFQFEAKPACPDSFCPTEYKGGDKVDKNEEKPEDKTNEDKPETTETKEDPPKVVKQVVVKKQPAKDLVDTAKDATAPTGDTQAEFIAKLIRQNEQYESRLKAVEADLKVREDAHRKDLIESIPEEHRALAEKLENEALLNVANILKKDREITTAKKDAATIVETGAVETTDQKNQDEETTENPEKDPEEIERDFFDKSGVFTVSDTKSGIRPT